MQMRILIVFLAIFCVHSFNAQLNQLDKQGRKQGIWKKTFPKSKAIEFEGQFKDDIPFGQFIYYYPSGNVKAKLFFVNNSTVTYSTSFYDVKDPTVMSIGKYDKQMKDSIWRYFGAAGILSVVESYNKGKLHGVKKVYFLPSSVYDTLNGVAQVLNFENNVLHGECLEYFDNGKLKTKSNYVNGLKEGISYTYYPNGNINLKDAYVDGLKHGLCIANDIDGNEIGRAYYCRGERLEGKELEKFLLKAKSMGKVIR